LGAIILFSLFTGPSFVKLANANPGPILPPLPSPIYIRANGAIDGASGALVRNGDTYIFSRNIDRTIEIQKNNITLDGNGFNLTKPPEVNLNGINGRGGWFSSVTIANKSSILIKNINFQGCYNSICISNSSAIIVFNNTISGSLSNGVEITNSVYCQILGNKITHARYLGLFIYASNYLNISYNTISENYYNGAQITASYSDISQNNVNNNTKFGLYFMRPADNNRIYENNFMGNEHGLSYTGLPCHDNQVYNNFWNNSEENSGIGAADKISGTDQSPLSSPVPIVFEPALFPSLNIKSEMPFGMPVLPELLFQFSAPIAGVAIAIIILFATSMLLYKKRKKTKKNV
jgi:parallel beta-helix repeat protein